MAAVDEIIRGLPRRTFDTPGHDLAHQEDRRLRLKRGTVWAFKRTHRLPTDQPLSPAAEALLLQEVETATRAAKGQEIERRAALTALLRVTPEQAAAVVAAIPSSRQLIDAVGTSGVLTTERYMLDRVEQLTGKRYTSIGIARHRCLSLVPAAAPAEPPIGRDYFGDTCRRDQAIFWGVILRLDHLQGPPPADPAAFYQWALLHAYQGHQETPRSLSDLRSGRMGEQQARTLLGLPVSGPLATAAIRTAYRQAAADHHPDRGGDAARFDQLTQARDRLLQEASHG